MKHLLFLAILLVSLQVLGQDKFVPQDFIPGNIPSYKPAYQEDYPDWAKMLYQTPINYYEIEEAYEQWKGKENDSFKPIEKYYQIWKSHILPFVSTDGSIQLDGVDTYYQNLLAQQQSSPSGNSTRQTEWTFVGPKETFWLNENGSPTPPASCPWQVNVYTFDVAKSNYSTLYSGTETGFVSKSTDNGASWSLLGRGYSFGGGITGMAIHPLDEDVVYVAAGQQIHKTTDGGQNWTPMLPIIGQFPADQITINPTVPNKIYAAGASGIFYSEDDGESWTQVWMHQAYDIHVKPNDPNVIYALSTVNGSFRVLLSSDGGTTFSEDAQFPDQIQDAAGGVVAVSPAAPNNLYVLLLGSNNVPYFYTRDMVFGSWELVASGMSSNFPMNNGQGFYDLVLEVSPLDAELIFAGTTTLYKTTNGGSHFTIVGGYGGAFPIHPDIQDMLILDDGSTWVATDGGFTHSLDNFSSPANATAKNKNLIGSHMWGFDQGWNEDLMVGGRYHNGNTAIADFYQSKALRMGGAESPTGWVMKGKSKQVVFDDLGPGWILPETAESQPQGRFLFSKHPNMDEYGGRRGNLLFHPNYFEVLYLGEGNAFWQSTDMGASFEMLHDFGSRVRFCQIGYDNPNVIYIDVVNQGLWRSDDGGFTWNAKPSLTSGTYGSDYWAGKLHFVLSPTDAHTIYACLQNGSWSADVGKVFKSTDGGDSWEDWTGTMDEFTKTLVIQPDADGQDLLYLFTDYKNGKPAKCYIRKHSDSDWTTYGEAYPVGMSPNHSLPFFRDSKIRVAGNGGIWENQLAEPNFQPFIQPWTERPFVDCMLDTITLNDHSILNHANASWSWDIQPAPIYLEDANKQNPKLVLGNPGSYDVTLTVTKDGISYTKTIEDMIRTQECPSLDNCLNPAPVPKESWTLKYVDSEEVNVPGLATMAFDNDPSTIWHTRWSTGSDPYPHEIQIDLGAVYDVYEFTYQTRQNGENGRIKDFELYFSEDLNDWGMVDTAGAFVNTAAAQKMVFTTPKVGRYFKLVALSEVNGGPWASAAEFEVTGCYHETTTAIGEVGRQSLKAFPVPTKGLFQVSLPSNESFSYAVYTLAGQRVSNGQISSGNAFLQVDLSPFASGMYVIKLVDAYKRSFFVKVVKED